MKMTAELREDLIASLYDEHQSHEDMIGYEYEMPDWYAMTDEELHERFVGEFGEYA
jgi:hypothetical protein